MSEVLILSFLFIGMTTYRGVSYINELPAGSNVLAVKPNTNEMAYRGCVTDGGALRWYQPGDQEPRGISLFALKNMGYEILLAEYP